MKVEELTMWECPSCKKENMDSIKKCQCGFDHTRNYVKFLSLTTLPSEEKEWWKNNQFMNAALKEWYDWLETLRPVVTAMSEKELRVFLDRMKLNYETAVKEQEASLKRRACNLNDEGDKWYNGEEGNVNYDYAVYYYKKAVELGNIEAMNSLGICYLRGYGVKRDDEKAAQLFVKSAEAGNRYAMHNAGWCYQTGRGVEKNIDKTLYWYGKSAELGFAKAQRKLGDIYYGKAEAKGGQAEKNDYLKLAVEWYRKAANGGDVEAQCNMGYLYRNGKGVTMSKKIAFGWYEAAAKAGDYIAQMALAEMYENGEGVKKDLDLAFYWRNKYLKDS